MTLPFRGRHHDHESTHHRARALFSAELLEPLGDDETTWLARHLETCAECTRDRAAYAADHDLLRGLRDASPQPPRDLWARTSAAIDREASGRGRGPAGARAATRQRWGGLPVGPAAGALVVLIVFVGIAIPRNIPQVIPPASDAVGQASPPPLPPVQPTPLAVAAGDVGYIRPGANGRWELVISKVDEVCPRSRQGCELEEDTASQTLDLGGSPTGVTMSPGKDQLVVQSKGHGTGTQPDKVYVVALATPAPGGTDNPPTEAPPTDAPATDPPGSPGSSPIVLPSETPGSTPIGAIEIASGVILVGEAAYSASGDRLAFSARPADGSTGPDLYLWQAGDAAATRVTEDHQTYFSAWLGDSVLASRVAVPGAEPVAGAVASGDPATPEASVEPSAGPTTEASPAASPDAPAGPDQVRPVSFLFDPATGVSTDLTQPDVWLPVVDPERRVTAYWSGTLVPTADGLDWQLGEGQLVLDRWVEPGSPSPSEPAAASSDPATEPTADPSGDPSAAPLEVVGPAGTPTPLEVGDVAVFEALFGTEGKRLAIWASDDAAAEVGRLHLLVLDPEAGTVDADLKPLAGEPALRRFSIDEGRLAWVSPPGQDGQESSVRVLGWHGRDFGEIKTLPAKDLFIVR